MLGILSNSPIRRENTHPRDVFNRTARPRFLIEEFRVDVSLSPVETLKVGQHHVMVAPIHQRMEDVIEPMRLVRRKMPKANLVERELQFRILLVDMTRPVSSCTQR